LRSLTARWVIDDRGSFQRLVVERGANGRFATRIETAPSPPPLRLGSGTIRTSLFAAVDDSRIPDEVAVQVADIFSSEIDFHRGLRKGDRFSVVYEALEADGEPLRTGRVLSVEFVNNGKPHQAMWFQEPGSKGAYYTLDGKSLTSSYLASPMEFSRVTSSFKMRFHPILKQWQAHLGVDFGAPTGTPVRTVGDGIVEFAGVQNGFGNVVFVATTAPTSPSTRTCRASTCARARRSARASASAPSAPPAGPPARTCTSSSASTAPTATRSRSPAAARA
jgi:hypothetical protein